MSEHLVPKPFWGVIEPLFSVRDPSYKVTSRPIHHRAIFVLPAVQAKTCIGSWELPTEMGTSPCSEHRRLVD